MPPAALWIAWVKSGERAMLDATTTTHSPLTASIVHGHPAISSSQTPLRILSPLLEKIKQP
jgi:hypothetical protein